MFQLNFYSSESPITVETIREDRTIQIKGEWKDKGAAGCLNYSSWRYNPQYLLTLSKPSRTRIQLEQIPLESLKFIGFYVVRGYGNFAFINFFLTPKDNQNKKLLLVTKKDLLGNTEYINQTSGEFSV